MTKYGEYGIFSKHNNDELITAINQNNNGICPNFGNRLWFQGLISEII